MPCLNAKLSLLRNQVRLAPGVYQDQVVAYCREKGILLEKLGGLLVGELFDSKHKCKKSQQIGKSKLQIAPWPGAWQEDYYHPKNLSQSRI